MRKIARCIAALAIALSVGAARGDITEIVAPIYNSDKIGHDAYYFTRLLRLSLDNTVAEYGEYRLRQPDVLMVDDRLKAAVIQERVDVMWHSVVGSVEPGLRAVDFSLLGALSQYRLLLVRDGEQQRFTDIASLDQLRELVAGVGAQWPDVAVLAENRLPHVTSSGYPQLFRMLAAGRFDYFPRGLYQIHSEVGKYPELDLVIAPQLMLRYPNRVQFLVREGDKHLAQRLLLGLQRAEADGSIDRLVDSVPRLQWAREQLQQGQYRVLELDAVPRE